MSRGSDGGAPADRVTTLPQKIRKSETAVSFLRIASRFCTAIFVLAAVWIAVSAFLRSAKDGILICLFGVLSFSAVSLFRRVIDLPRPYDALDILPEEEKKTLKTGKSFPSRHAFFAFLIAGLACSFSVVLACILFALALVLSSVRVLLAYHYPRDVIAGALLGLVSAGLALLFLHL